MAAFSGEDVPNDPKTLALFESDDAAMSYGVGESSISIVLRVEQITLAVAHPTIYSWTNIRGEHEKLTFGRLAYLLAIDPNRVVISRRAKKVPQLFARGVSKRPGIAQECSVESEHLERQRVRVRMRAVPARAVIPAVDDRVKWAAVVASSSSLNEDLSFGERLRGRLPALSESFK